MRALSQVSTRLRGVLNRFNPTVRYAALICLLAANSSPAANPILEAQSHSQAKGIFAFAAGGGTFLVGEDIEVDFAFFANQRHGRNGRGRFHFKVELGGLPIDFRGEVICVAVDRANDRAWIGAVVTRNQSEHPSFIGEIHQPGRDVWFRVLDSGHGFGSDMDRSTFLGFEGAGGIVTSEEYCDAQIWPDDNARTSPVIRGGIRVLP